MHSFAGIMCCCLLAWLPVNLYLAQLAVSEACCQSGVCSAFALRLFHPVCPGCSPDSACTILCPGAHPYALNSFWPSATAFPRLSWL